MTTSLEHAVALGDGSTFSSVSHKVKTTIGMPFDEEFGEAVTSLKDLFVAQRVQTNEFINKRKQFDNMPERSLGIAGAALTRYLFILW